MNTLIASAYVATDTPARYISRLCRHFAHKLTVSFDEHRGSIRFDAGHARLHTGSGGLTLTVEAASQADLHRLQHVVASHFERFAWQDALQLEWKPV